MRVFIDFWKLETENSILHVFSFLHKLSFENSFCFLSILGCQTSFLVSKIENCFWKHKIKGKDSYQNTLTGSQKKEKRKRKKKTHYYHNTKTIGSIHFELLLNSKKILSYLFNQILKNLILLKYRFYGLQTFWITFKFKNKF